MLKFYILAICLLAGCGGGGGAGGMPSPISQAQAQAAPKTEVIQIHCILRPDASGKWYIQNDVDHMPYGCDLRIEQGADYLRVFFLGSFTHAGTVQITSDDDFNVKIKGFANLGLNSAMVKVFANGQQINPADVYNHIPQGGGNFWINATMITRR